MEKVRKITAWITVIVIVGLIIGTLICAVTGSDYFFGMLALTFIVPVILWVFMWFSKLVNGNQEMNTDSEQTQSEEK
ncbi:MAG: hypothetical protein J6C01_01965 [Lachnospiraceae bacterium]|nr:hypothetical protein [Lachnospiraceae bacterium]